MGRFSMNMSNESDRLEMELKDGWYNFEIVSMDEKTSKSGNNMFEIQLALSSDPSQGCKVYAIAEEGKRWFLKSLLQACGYAPDEEGLYDFDTDDMIGKNVAGKVVNQKEIWIDRDGRDRETTKAKIVNFNKMGFKGKIDKTLSQEEVEIEEYDKPI